MCKIPDQPCQCNRFIFQGKLNKILQGYLLPPTDHSSYYRQNQLEYFNNFQSLIFPPSDTGHGSIWILFAFYISLLSHEKKNVRNANNFSMFLSLYSLLISWGFFCLVWFVSGILCYDDRELEEIGFG